MRVGRVLIAVVLVLLVLAALGFVKLAAGILFDLVVIVFTFALGIGALAALGYLGAGLKALFVYPTPEKPAPVFNQGQLGGARLHNVDDYGPSGFLADDGESGPQLSYIAFTPRSSDKEVSKFVTYPGDGHLLTVAPAGKGKSAGPVMCNLVAYPGSVVVTDVKGELAAHTACWRSQGLGQAVFVVDPWGIVADEDIPGGGRARFNPLDVVPGRWVTGAEGEDPVPLEGPDSYDDARLIADAIILQGSESDPHWDRSAKALLTGLILTVALDPVFTGPRTLGSVNDILNLPDADFRTLLAGISAGPIEGAAAEINRFLQKAEKEASGVLSTIHTNMTFLQSRAMRDVFSASDFAWADVKRQPTSIYLCIPPRRLGTHAQFLRLMFIAAISGMESVPIPAAAPGRKWHSVLFLMDEFANLGRMDRLLDAFALMRGFGLKFWAFVQDLNQLHDLYGDRWQTFIANAGVIQSFGTRDSFTAEQLSRLSGQKTEVLPGESHSVQGGGTSVSKSVSLTGRPLLYPGDFTALADDRQILMMESKVFTPPKTLWFKAWPYRRLAEFNRSRKLETNPRIPRLGVSASV